MTTANTTAYLHRVGQLMGAAKYLAREYRTLTGRPLGITGEVAEYEAVRLLNLERSEVRQEGYDAVCMHDGSNRRIQIKGRVLLPGAGRGQRVPAINLTKEWDSVMVVTLDPDFEPLEIREADRSAVSKALTAPGSKARNERGQLALSKFKAISRQVWARPEQRSNGV